MDVQKGIETNAPAPRAVRVEQAARAIGLGRTTLYGLIASGQIRTLKVGGRRLVPLRAIDEFIERESRKCAEQEKEEEENDTG